MSGRCTARGVRPIGRATARSRVNQYKGFATVFYDIAPEHPVDFTHLYLPTMEFYLCRVQGPWVFAQEGDAYCAVYCSAGLTASASARTPSVSSLRPAAAACGWVRAAQTDEFPSFAAFITAMLAAPLEVDAQRLACRFEDPVYGVLRSGWNERLSVNGAAMEYGGSDQYGVLELPGKTTACRGCAGIGGKNMLDQKTLHAALKKVSAAMMHLENTGFEEKYPIASSTSTCGNGRRAWACTAFTIIIS